jgi:hypothetical protein
MAYTRLDNLKEIASDCFSKEPEPIYKRAKEAAYFIALAAFLI